MIRRLILIAALLACLPAAARATDITVSSFNTAAVYQQADTIVALRLYYSQTIVDSLGNVVVGGAIDGPNFFKQSTCTLNSSTKIVNCGSFTMPSTLDSSNPLVTVTGVLYGGKTSSSLVKRSVIFSNWKVPATPTTTTYADLNTYNLARHATLSDSYYTTAQIDTRLAALTSTATKASDVIFGVGKTSVAPASAANPIFVGQNDPRVGTTYNPMGYPYNALCDGNGTTGTDDSAAFNTLKTAIGTTAATIRLPGGKKCRVGSISWPANVVFDFTEGGALQGVNSSTLTIAGPIVAAPEQQIFYNYQASQGSVVFSQIGLVYAAWWGDAVAEVGAPVNAAIQAITAIGGEIRLPNSANIQQTVSINLTYTGVSSQNTIIISGYGGRSTRIESKLTNGNSIDCTGRNHVIFKDFLLSGNQSFMPKVGFLLARNSNGGNNNGGQIYFYRVETLNFFSVAALYNYASEDMRVYDGLFVNNADNAATVVLTHNNISSITSAVAGGIATGGISSTEFRFWGTQLSADGNGNIDALFIQGCDQVSYQGGIMTAAHAARSFVYIDASVYPSVHLDFANIQFDGNATVNNGFYVKGGSAQSVAYLSIQGIYDLSGVKDSSSGGRSFNSEASVTIDQFRFRNFYAPRGLYMTLTTGQYCDIDLGPGGTLNNPGTITNSLLKVSGNPALTIIARPDLNTSNTVIFYNMGGFQLGAPVVTLASPVSGFTYNNPGELRRQTFKATLTNVPFAAAATTKDVTIATLPAKTNLVGIYADVTQTFTGGAVTATTLKCGKTAGGAEYLVSFDVFTATIRRGLADADLGTSINRANAIQGGDMPSFTGTTAVQCRMTTTTANTNALTQGSVTIYLITEILP